MSKLQKAISRIQKREAARLGFGAVAREQPRAMLAGGMAKDVAGLGALRDGGADVAILTAAHAAAAVEALKGFDAGTLVVGVKLDALEVSGSAALREAGCDFVVSPIDTTAAAALEPDSSIDYVAVLPAEVSDTTLRALAPIGLAGIFVEGGEGEMTLARQLDFVRLSSFAAAPLFIAPQKSLSASELRVLRDSGGASLILPAGAGAADIESLIANLKAVPAPRKGRRDSGGDIALVPSRPAEAAAAEEDDDGE